MTAFGVNFFLLLCGLGLAALAVYLFMSTIFRNNSDSDALAWASGDEPVKSKSGLINFSRPLVHNFTVQHATRVKSTRYRESVRRKLLTAGLSGELNVDEFIGLQILWGVMMPIALLVLNFALQLGYPPMICVLIGMFGVYYPHLYCRQEQTRRYTSIISDLPFFIDLLALSTKAGMDFVGAIQHIVEKAENSVLADEFQLVLKDIKLGSARKDAMGALAERLDVPELTSFIAVLRDADETGSPISQVLSDQSVQMRLERFVRAEKAGAKASQLMMIPMMAFVMPAVMIIVFGPVILQFIYGGK